MKKDKLMKMALLGLAHGLLLNGQAIAETDMANIENLIASNPEVFPELKSEAVNLLSRLNSEGATTYLAANCGAGKCSTVANKCGAGKCSTVANKCGAGKCSTVANKCGAGKCSTIANKCGAGKCSTVASKCGAGKCSTIAQRDTATTPLQDPSKVNLKDDKYKEVDLNSENMNYRLMTEDDLLLELNDEGTKLYQSLSPEGKKLALTVASQYCNGTNECKGLNSCQTEKNKCAGQGSCKGQSKCAISDKNLAVKLVHDKMAAKRNDALSH